jgi:hypothetical protein
MPVSTSNFGELLEPGLRRIYGLAYAQYPEEYSQIFSVETSTRAFEESLSLSGFGLVPEKPQGSSVSYSTPKQNWVHRLTHTAYGLGYIVTREMFEDEQYRQINNFSRALARSVRYTIEAVAANVLNNAFDSSVATGGDGLELCSTAHLLGGGGTYRNELSAPADLSSTSLEQALIDISNLVDDQGLNIQAKPVKLVVPPKLDWTAQKLLGSTLEPESANNAINPANGRMPYTVNHFLTDPDAWFIITDVPNGLVFYWRRRPEFTRDNDFDTENAKFKTTFRFVAGWDDPRGIFGSPGA